jgi:hypothetical protein
VGVTLLALEVKRTGGEPDPLASLAREPEAGERSVHIGQRDLARRGDLDSHGTLFGVEVDNYARLAPLTPADLLVGLSQQIEIGFDGSVAAECDFQIDVALSQERVPRRQNFRLIRYHSGTMPRTTVYFSGASASPFRPLARKR